ncbi:hypothetical protein CM49_01510 [Paenibacillus sp. P1XP2]|nr:hypothetical protein CM49_01510 [Paenibacillus sp. P1XP2]
MHSKAASPPLLWGDKRFHTWNYEMRREFDEKVFKVMLDAASPARTATARSPGAAARSAARADRETSPANAVTTSSPNSMKSGTNST